MQQLRDWSKASWSWIRGRFNSLAQRWVFWADANPTASSQIVVALILGYGVLLALVTIYALWR